MLASASTASRALRDRRRPRVDAHRVLRAPPGPADLAVDEEGAGPDARGPEQLALLRAGHEELPLGAVEEEVRIAARQQPRGRRGGRGGTHLGLVVREQPLVAERRSDGHEGSLQRGVRGGRRAGRRSRPACEPGGRRRAEDVEVTAGELAARVGGLDVGRRDTPDDRRAGAAPPDLDRAGRRGVPDRGAETERAPRLAVGHATAVEMGVDRGRDAARSQAALLGVGVPPEREQREVAPRNDVRVVARSPELGERGVVQRRRPDTRDARVQGEKRRPRHAVLQPCPGRPLERGRPRTAAARGASRPAGGTRGSAVG